MKSYLAPFLLLAFFSVPVFSQNDLRRDSVPPTNMVFMVVDEEASFPGGSRGIERFLRKNFVYPEEAWGKAQTGPLRFYVRQDGVACGLQQGSMSPELYRELRRVFGLMPLWTPATVSGRPVNSAVSMDMLLYDAGSGLPFHIVEAMKEVHGYLDTGRKYRHGADAEEASKAIAGLEDIVAYAAENVEAATALARWEMALGRKTEAVGTAGKCARTYHSNRGRMQADAIVAGLQGTTVYDGRKDICAAMTCALLCAAAEDRRSEKAFRRTLDIIDGRIRLQDVNTPDNRPVNGEYRKLMEEKLALVMRPGTGGVALNEEDRHEIAEARTYGGMMRVIDKKVNDGKISNARVLQITRQMEDIKSLYGKEPEMGKDSLNLYGLRALTLYLSQGIEAQRQYMDSLSGQSKELKKYFEKMSENMRKHEAELSDRAAVIRSLACFAPINEEGDSKEEKKRRAKEFYRYRDAVKETYPLEWLWK